MLPVGSPDTMTAYRPRLRAHLRIEAEELVDPLLNRSFPLHGTVAALAPRLDGVADWDAIRAGLIADGLDGDDVDSSLRGLLCVHLVEGAGDQVTAALQAMIATEDELPMTTLGGARFACQGSGGCCSGYSFGPLSEPDIARLEALDLAAAFPHLTAPYLEDGERGRFLRRDGERCIFLGADRRCGIHAAFGAEAKPGFCQIYPLDSFVTVDGVRVVDRGTCATFGVSARTGLPVVDDLPRVRAMLEPRTLHHPLAFVDGLPWDYGLFLRFTRAAIALVERRLATAGETLAAITELLDALVAAVHDCPLEAGQPDAAVAAVLAAEPTTWYREPDHVSAIIGQRRLVSLLDELAPAMSEAVAAGHAQATAARFDQLVELIEHVANALVERDGSATAVIHGPDVDDALRISMRQQLFGRAALVGGHVGAGLIRLGLLQLFALAAARKQAGDRPLVAADLNAGHSLAARVLESGALDRLLVFHESRWRPLVAGIAIAMRVVG